MNMTALVIGAIKELGRANINTLQTVFPDNTRREIQHAINHAKDTGYIEAAVPGKSGTGPYGGRTPSIWQATEKVHGERRARVAKTPQPKVASVFEMGSPRTDWPAVERGTQYAPLGAWETE